MALCPYLLGERPCGYERSTSIRDGRIWSEHWRRRVPDSRAASLCVRAERFHSDFPGSFEFIVITKCDFSHRSDITQIIQHDFHVCVISL